MPFDADIRAGLFSVELNINSIVEELENLLEKTLDISQDYEKGGVVWKYVYDLENDYSAHMNSTNSPVNFWEWFTDNYNNVYSYEDLIWEEVDEWCYENHNECICETGGCAKPRGDEDTKEEKENKKKIKFVVKKEEEEEDEDTKYIVRFERAVYGDEHGDIMYMDTVDETEYDTLHEAREAYDSYEVQDTGELLYLDMISGEDEEHENVDMRGNVD